MTAKDKQAQFIKSYLKPKLKDEGYRTSARTWWKFRDEFFIVINLQNSQWNEKNRLSFCFNAGVGLTANLKDQSKNPTQFDIITFTREDAYLPKNRNKHKFRKDSWLGYIMTETTNLEEFTKELSIDFEEHILPKLNRLQTLEDCVEFYGPMGVYGEMFKERVEALGLG